MTQYRIRKVGKLWSLYERHGPNGAWHGPVMQSSHWRNVAWVATRDPRYRMPGYILWPTVCHS